MKIEFTGFLLLIAFITLHAAASSINKFNLPFEPTTNRFTVTDKIWPQNYGDVSVCLWKDDKMAAISLTIDDNYVQDHPWWIAQGQKYGWKFTWFVIAQYVTTLPDYYGPWDAFRKLYALGHDIQSHTYTHNIDTNQSDSSFDFDYRVGKRVIEDSVPGVKCLTLAYPGGITRPKIAEKYYIAARGVTGLPNAVQNIWYMSTWAGEFSIPAIHDLFILNPKESFCWRGWAAIFTHGFGAGSTPEIIQASYDSALTVFDYIKKNEKDLWVGTFTEVAKYGEERDTHILSIKEIKPDKITFSISDSMVDSIFDYPLTVKIAISSSWVMPIFAMQGKDTLWDTVIINNGKPYVVVNAIPDKGDVTVFPSSLSIKKNSAIKPAPFKWDVIKKDNKIIIQCFSQKNQRITLSLFTENGRLIKVLFDDTFSAGQYKISQPLNLATGLYYLNVDIEHKYFLNRPLVWLN